ncbi:uncharacterized protein LOC107819076 isoform X2 [Nicotiana tabacum]|uniref:Uncharacterized protein LOC107819076 isoform X2 n=1 Tax=Nicotiana tabacum TaxID=4097 RepID=A0AC58TQT1_TOBAC
MFKIGLEKRRILLALNKSGNILRKSNLIWKIMEALLALLKYSCNLSGSSSIMPRAPKMCSHVWEYFEINQLGLQNIHKALDSAVYIWIYLLRFEAFGG